MKTVIVAATISLLLALFGTPLAIRLFRRRGYGQPIREEGPATHQTKRGTPTMGGTVIVIASLIGYFAANLITKQPVTVSGLLVLGLMTIIGTFGMNFTVLLPVLARVSLRAGAVGFGFVSAAVGAGALAGALVIASISRATVPMLLAGATAFALLELALWAPIGVDPRKTKA